MVVTAEAAAGNVEDIGDRITASLEEQITGAFEKSRAEAKATQRARVAVQISSMAVASEVGSSIIILVLLGLEIKLGGVDAGEAALSKGLGSEAKIRAVYNMLILVVVDLLALSTSSAIIRWNHIKELRAQVATELPGATQRERSASIGDKRLKVDVLHRRWRYEMWATHSWYMAFMAFYTFSLCTFCGSLFVQSFGCRGNCAECADRSSCSMRGRDCLWVANPDGISSGLCSRCDRCDPSCLSYLDTEKYPGLWRKDYRVRYSEECCLLGNEKYKWDETKKFVWLDLGPVEKPVSRKEPWSGQCFYNDPIPSTGARKE